MRAGKLTDRSERGSFSETSAGVPACPSWWNLGKRASMSITVEPRQACQHVHHGGTSAGVPACRSRWNLGRRASMSITVVPRQACQHVHHGGTSAGVPACPSWWNLGRRASMSITVEPRQACQHVDRLCDSLVDAAQVSRHRGPLSLRVHWVRLLHLRRLLVLLASPAAAYS